MAEDDATSPTKPSWHEREIAEALQRLANARAQLATLEEQVEAAAARPEPDPGDVARAEALQAEVVKLTAKASGRFKGSARAKLEATERDLRLVLDRLGVERLEQLAEVRAEAAVDPTVLDFARRECADAEQAFLEIAALEIPEADDEPEDDQPDAEVIPAAETFGDAGADVDLRIEPSAAS